MSSASIGLEDVVAAGGALGGDLQATQALRRQVSRRAHIVRQRTRLKNRLSATLAKYGTPASECSDPYGKRGRAELEKHLEGLPEQTRWVSGQLLTQLDFVTSQVRQLEERLAEMEARLEAAIAWEASPASSASCAPSRAEEGSMGPIVYISVPMRRSRSWCSR